MLSLLLPEQTISSLTTFSKDPKSWYIMQKVFYCKQTTEMAH